MNFLSKPAKVVTLLGFCSQAAWATPNIVVDLPGTVLELRQQIEFDVYGEGFDDVPLNWDVSLNGIAINSSVVVSTVNEDRVDGNLDGVLDSYSGAFVLTLNSVDLDPSDILLVHADAPSPNGTVEGRGSSEVISHLDVNYENLSEGSGLVDVNVFYEDIDVVSHAVYLTVNGVDVDGGAIGSWVITSSEVSAQDPNVTISGAANFVIDFGSVTLNGGDVVSVKVVLVSPDGPTEAACRSVVSDP